MAAATLGSLLKVEVKAPTSPNSGEVAQTISQGRSPLTANTAIINPHNKNHRLAFSFIVRRTSALMMALSMLVIVSNTKSPPIIIKIDIMSIGSKLYGKTARFSI